jgi:hypothetical protein
MPNRLGLINTLAKETLQFSNALTLHAPRLRLASPDLPPVTHNWVEAYQRTKSFTA